MFAFFRVSVAGSTPQTIVVFKLNNDKCPKTCDNFIAICQSRAKAKRPTVSASSSHDVVEPTYRGTEFHRIIPGFMVQGGDFSMFDGKGGFAAPTTTYDGKPTFPDECFDISHDREGILSMANRGKNTNGSQFFITLGKALHLDGKHVAFGSVVRNLECVKQIAQVETDSNGKPVVMQRVVITDCGIGTGDDDSGSDSGSSSSSSASSKKKRRRRSGKEYESSSTRKKRKRSHSSRHQRKRDNGDDDDSNRKHKKKSKEKTSHRHRKRDHETKKRQKKDDERHPKKQKTLR